LNRKTDLNCFQMTHTSTTSITRQEQDTYGKHISYNYKDADWQPCWSIIKYML